jgi:hypothetical protein
LSIILWVSQEAVGGGNAVVTEDITQEGRERQVSSSSDDATQHQVSTSTVQ